MSAAELSAFCPEAALVGSKLQMDQEKSGVHLADAGARAELRRLMELGQHYPSAFNAALVGQGGGGADGHGVARRQAGGLSLRTEVMGVPDTSHRTIPALPICGDLCALHL